MLKKFLVNSKQTQKKVETQIRKDVGSFVKKVTLTKQKDFLVLERRVRVLEAQLKTRQKSSKKKKKVQVSK